MNLWSMLARAERLWPQATAAVDGEQRLSYAQIAERTRSLSLSLSELGLRPGDRLAILEHNSAPYLETYFAAAGLGAILCPLNVRLAPGELSAILADSGACTLIAGVGLADLARAARTPEVERVIWTGAPADEADSYGRLAARKRAAFESAAAGGDDVAQLYYTSGTTGRPKGVMLSHRNVSVHALAAVAELGLSDADVWGHFAPMFHLADAWATFAITWVGGRHVFVPRFEEAAVLDALERERVTLTNLIPTMLNRLVRTSGPDGPRGPTGIARRDLSAMRLVLSGGAPIAPELVRAVMALFRCEYVQTYGMTETSPYLTLSRLKEHLKALPAEEQFRYRAKTGRAFLGVELEVVGDDELPVACDGRTVGEIRVRGETVTRGYWNRPDETAAAFRDGWFCTGDLATIDAEGYVDIVDRRKDMIITGGEKVYSTEVEHVLALHPAVLEAAVFGAHDPLWGESVHAAVCLRSGASASAEELISLCRAHLAGFKAPEAITFLPELPKTGTGKLSKRALREAQASGWPELHRARERS